ncbi:Mu-like prophage protein gp16, partial [Tistlia consotensis]|uniref:regulatory protein GemA n=1 Tax=Tistlia consotensis TaxID=1321365 RepID=UPI000B7528B1
DDSYRALLQRLTGKTSAAELTPAQLGRVIEELDRLGAYRRQQRAARSYPTPQARMARGLWIELHRMGVVRNRTDQALDAFVRKLAGVDSARWLTDPAEAGKVIEALKAMKARAHHHQGDRT